MSLTFLSRIPSPRAVFSYQVYGNVVAVIDHDRGRSVTNDAENVIADLAQQFDLTKFRVIYRDTRGVWDELLAKDGRFAGFHFINERDLDKALVKLDPAVGQ